jgi:hypothetical protein
MDERQNPYASPMTGLARDVPSPEFVGNPLAHPAVIAGAVRVRKWILPYVVLISIFTVIGVLGLLAFIVALSTIDVSPAWLAAAGFALVVGTVLTVGVLITASGYRGKLAHFLYSHDPDDLTAAVRQANTGWKLNIAVGVFYMIASFGLTQWLTSSDPTWPLRLERRFAPAGVNRPAVGPQNPGRFR